MPEYPLEYPSVQLFLLALFMEENDTFFLTILFLHKKYLYIVYLDTKGA